MATQSLERFFSKVITRENFDTVNQMNPTIISALPAILANLVIIFVLLFIGKYLWNNYLLSMLTIVNPVDSVIHILALYVLIQLLA
jgi:hypothetical protein